MKGRVPKEEEEEGEGKSLDLLGFGKVRGSLGRLLETGTQVLLTWVWH